MTPPNTLLKTIMISIMILSSGIMLLHLVSIIIALCLALSYMTRHIIHTLNVACRYRHTQYYAVYKTPFHHLINNTDQYKQYIIYQTLLKAFAHNSDILISQDPRTLLFIHPSGLYLFSFGHIPPSLNTIPHLTVKSDADIHKHIKKIATKNPIHSFHKRMTIYDSILTNPHIPYI